MRNGTLSGLQRRQTALTVIFSVICVIYVLPVLATLLAAIAPPDTLRRRCRPAGRGLAAVMAAALMAVTFICAWQEVFQTMYGL